MHRLPVFTPGINYRAWPTNCKHITRNRQDGGLGVWRGVCLLFILFYFILTCHMSEINCEYLLNALARGPESSACPKVFTMCSVEWQ